MSLQERLTELVRACFAGLWIQSYEHEDALAEIGQLCRQENWKLASWDIDRGQVSKIEGRLVPPLADRGLDLRNPLVGFLDPPGLIEFPAFAFSFPCRIDIQPTADRDGKGQQRQAG